MKNKGIKSLIVILVILIIVAGGCLAYKIYQEKNQNQSVSNNETEQEPKKEEKKVQIYQGNERPLAVMIDNHKDAWPQAGLNQAYMVYEIVVEGGETRLMALFKGADVEKIGPVRSSRHYFLDYAMENDAIYAHYGWSPQAESDIKKYSIHNLNGITESTETFWRVKDKAAPHNAVTSTKALLEAATKKGYRTTSDKESVLHYVTDEVTLEEGMPATTIILPHSNLQTVKYEYDETTGTYKRYARNIAQTDWDTKSPITTKNIIVTLCDNYTLQDSENKGRQGLYNIGTFEGYYITNGKAIKIKCTKNARDEKTKYYDLEGKEINVNDGNTFVQICPKDSNIKIEGVEETPSNETNTNNT